MLILLTGSCKKKVLNVLPAFEGNWYSEPFGPEGEKVLNHLEIDGTTGTFYEHCTIGNLGSICESEFFGFSEVNFIQTKLYIGHENYKSENEAVWTIDIYPYEITPQNWECTLSGIKYYKN